jgi:predicted DNA-binding protein (MmcQ/YjbR family)
MYSDGDPYLAELRSICLAFPESVELEAWGRPTFRAGKKMFAVFSDTAMTDRDEVDRDVSASVIFKADDEERPALLADPRFYIPPYFGPSGWMALRFAAAPVDWDEVTELVDTSYRLVALKRMLKALDAQAAPEDREP